jgi:hypothetical protein
VDEVFEADLDYVRHDAVQHQVAAAASAYVRVSSNRRLNARNRGILSWDIS